MFSAIAFALLIEGLQGIRSMSSATTPVSIEKSLCLSNKHARFTSASLHVACGGGLPKSRPSVLQAFSEGFHHIKMQVFA